MVLRSSGLVTLTIFSYFDTSNHPSRKESERFCYGFVLGLMVELADWYILAGTDWESVTFCKS